jgi:hypothetical protein
MTRDQESTTRIIQKAPSASLGIASMVLGGMSLILICMPCIGYIGAFLGLVGLIFAFFGLFQSGPSLVYSIAGGLMSLLGAIVCSIIAIGLLGLGGFFGANTEKARQKSDTPAIIEPGPNGNSPIGQQKPDEPAKKFEPTEPPPVFIGQQIPTQDPKSIAKALYDSALDASPIEHNPKKPKAVSDLIIAKEYEKRARSAKQSTNMAATNRELVLGRRIIGDFGCAKRQVALCIQRYGNDALFEFKKSRFLVLDCETSIWRELPSENCYEVCQIAKLEGEEIPVLRRFPADDVDSELKKLANERLAVVESYLTSADARYSIAKAAAMKQAPRDAAIKLEADFPVKADGKIEERIAAAKKRREAEPRYQKEAIAKVEADYKLPD